MIARRSVSLQQMGFTEWRRGAAWGGVLFVLTVVVLGVGAMMPVFSEMYHDRRVSGDSATFVYQAFVRIPLGTAVLEETAFRAVLPALFAVRWGVLRGCVAASACFGLWHVLPSLGLTKVNPAASRIFGSGSAGVVAAVVFAVVGTGLAGLWWCWIRYRAGSVLATMIAHVATNSVAYTIAWFVTR
jgi:membrane protease YdiL (CAAX protease family)